MNIRLTETQEMLRASAREFLSENCPPKTVRELRATGHGWSADLWRRFGELGWLGLALPESTGGSAMSFLDLCLLTEEMGYACVPSPFTDAVAGCGILLAEAGRQHDVETLEMLASGESVVIPAFSGSYDTDGFQGMPLVSRDGDGYSINGTHLFVRHGAAASHFLCQVQSDDDSVGPALILIPAHIVGVHLTELHSALDDRPCRIDLTGVQMPAPALVSTGSEAMDLRRHAQQRMDIARCFDNLGALTWVLEDTVAYARDRTQFGRPIGSFQILQHYCADMHIMLEGLRMSAYHAAWKMSEALDAARDTAIACGYAHQVIPRFLGLAHQIHGAMGVTLEHDLYLYSTHARAPGHGLTPLSEYLESTLSL